MLVESGVNINGLTSSGDNVLMLYIERAANFDPEIVKYLVRNGFNLNLTNDDVRNMVMHLGDWF